MSWVVVVFSATDEVEAIPQKWVSADEKQVVYPSYSRNRLEKAIKTMEEPDESWKTYGIKILSKKVYTKFAKADSKANKACDNSDIETSDNTLLPEKRRIFRTRLSSSGSSSDESLGGFPAITKSKEIRSQHKNLKGDDSSQQVKPIVQKIPSDQAKHSKEINIPLHNPSIQKEVMKCLIQKENNEITAEEANICTTSERQDLTVNLTANPITSNNSDLLKKLCKQEKVIKDHEKEIISMHATLKRNNTLLKQILSCVNDKEKEHTMELTTENDPFAKLPCEDNIQMAEVDSLLQNPNYFKKIVKDLSRIGGDDYKQAVKRIMERCFTNVLMSEYSITGHKGKKKLNLTKLLPAIIEAVQVIDSRVTSKEIEKRVAVVLSKATERLSRKTQEKTTNITVNVNEKLDDREEHQKTDSVI